MDSPIPVINPDPDRDPPPRSLLEIMDEMARTAAENGLTPEKLEEILAFPQCRHCLAIWDTECEYCPGCQLNYAGAKYPAVVTDKELTEAEALVAEIRQAFDAVRLNGGTTLHEGDLEGAHSDPGASLKAREKDPEQFWWEILDWKLEDLNSAVHFLDAKGFRFYLPAWMTWCLRHGKTSKSIALDTYVNGLVPSDLVPREPVFATLSLEQSRAVSRFLKHIAQYYPLTPAHKALRGYWHSFNE